jgi:hypothetical protein
MITGVAVYPYGVRYQAVWWSGGERKESWVEDAEIVSPAPPTLLTIGFAAAETREKEVPIDKAPVVRQPAR